jgi:hypothetical protein
MKGRRRILDESCPNGRAKFANGDFGRELPAKRREVIFSATTHFQMTPLWRAFQ